MQRSDELSPSVPSGAHNGKERPTSIPITRTVAAHDTPYTDPFAVCVQCSQQREYIFGNFDFGSYNQFFTLKSL